MRILLDFGIAPLLSRLRYDEAPEPSKAQTFLRSDKTVGSILGAGLIDSGLSDMKVDSPLLTG